MLVSYFYSALSQYLVERRPLGRNLVGDDGGGGRRSERTGESCTSALISRTENYWTTTQSSSKDVHERHESSELRLT
jgi:hypothetical protein